MSIPSEDVIINALNHDIRREILQLLISKPMSYSQLLNHFAISTGKLNYHLKLLTGFIRKTEEGLYANTQLGLRIISFLKNLKKEITEEDRSLLKKAYVTQIGDKKSFLQIRLIGGVYIKIIVILASLTLIITTTIMYALEGVPILSIWPLYLMLAFLVPVGLIWAFKMYKPAKEFTAKFDKLLDDAE